MHVLALGFSLVIVVFVVGVIAAAWIIRAVLFRRARAMGWTPPPGLRGGPDHPFYGGDPRGQAGHRHGGWGGFSGGHHGGGHHGGGGGGGDAGGGGHHH